MPPNLEPGKPRLNQKRGDALAARVRIGLRKHDEQTGDMPVRHPSLRPVQPINIPARRAERRAAPAASAAGANAGTGDVLAPSPEPTRCTATARA